jgi:hypothetical protein
MILPSVCKLLATDSNNKQMYSTLKIRNFGPVREADLTIRDINILVGEQGSGKSAVAKMITIFDDPSFVLRLNHCNDKGSSFDPTAVFHKYNIASYFSDTTMLTYVHPGYYAITYAGGKFELSITNRETLPLHNCSSLFIPAERSFVGLFSRTLLSHQDKESVPEPLVRFANLYERAKRKFKRFEVPFLGVEFIAGEGEDQIRLCKKDTTLSFRDASSGLQTVIPLLMVISYSLHEQLFNSFQIEEPELNLFPSSQLDLLKWLVSHCGRFSLTTQSPYMLKAINNMLFAGRLYDNTLTKEEVVKLVEPEYCLPAEKLSAYSLGNTKVGEPYCSSLFDVRNGLVEPDFLDSVALGQTQLFKKLFSLSLQSLRENLILPHE